MIILLLLAGHVGIRKADTLFSSYSSSLAYEINFKWISGYAFINFWYFFLFQQAEKNNQVYYVYFQVRQLTFVLL